MVSQHLTKPDGRELILYARDVVRVDGPAPSPSRTRVEPNGHLRWHPLRAEWISYATNRQDRTFQPSADHNPLAPTTDVHQPTELPAGRYDVAVFENLFPAFATVAKDPPALWIPTRKSAGRCEVVVFSQDPSTSLGALPLWHLELICEVWAERYRVLGARRDTHYVYVFENRGTEVGVTLSHPHGQIYAYPFVPPIPATELEQERLHLAAHGRGLLEDLVAAEVNDGRRLLYDGAHVVAFVPAAARYPYEVWVATRRRQGSLADLDSAALTDFARALKTVLLKYDRLWNRPFPYVMAFHQAPTDGAAHPEAHLHVEFYPPYRMEHRLKYLAGSEIGAGVFTADTDPDETAAQLRAVDVTCD